MKVLQEDFRVIDNCLCIRMPEEVDHHHAEELCRIADHYILEEQVENVLFDFEDTRFMDSSGIGILIGRYRLISCFGGKVYASHPDKQIRRMLEMSGMKKIVEIIGQHEMLHLQQKVEVEMKNEMRMEFDAVSENEGFARVAVAAFVTPLDPTLEEVADIKTAVSEAVTNAVIHAYPDWPEEKPRKVELRCSVNTDVLHIEIEDHGVGIADVEKAMEPLFSTCPDKDRSGMGFAFMEAFMDDLEVESTVGEGTVVRMEKKLGTFVWAEEGE